MLSLSQTHNDRRLIRVLVAPIGNNSLFADQFQIVSSLKSIPFYELNRPLTSKASPFKFLNWKDGELLFEYLRYDRSSAGPGDLDDFQSSKKIWMVMGLINFPELIVNVKTVSEEIDHFTRRYGHIGLKRIFVFNYNFDVQPSLQLKPLRNDPDSLIIFPPEGACEGGSMIVVHFKEVMCHATVKLINAFERLMELCEDGRSRGILPSEVPLHTVYDDREDIGQVKETPQSAGLIAASSSNRNKTKAYKKKPSGRLHKYMADLSMQVCSPLDAIDHYIAAIVELRSTADSLWLAGALDGYSSVVLMLRERQFNLDEIIGKDLKSVTLPTLPETDEPLPEIDRVYALAEERMSEAISIYSSSVVLRILEVEATLRLARIFEKANFFYEKEQKIVDYVMKAASIPGLNSQQQIEVTLEGALICHRLGLMRKYSLFLYIAALMTAESGNYEMADALLMETFLRLTDEEKDRGEGAATSSVSLCSAWSAVKSAVFTNGVILAQETNNSSSSATFLSGLLQLVCQAELRQSIQNSRLSKYTNKLLGLEAFARRNKITNWSSVSANASTGLTEESLKRLQHKDLLHQSFTSEHLSKRNFPPHQAPFVGPSGKARSVNSDLTTLAGGLKGSIRTGFNEGGGSGNNSQTGSAKLSNPMASPKTTSSAFPPSGEKPPNPPGTPVITHHRAQSEKLTPTHGLPSAPNSIVRRSSLQEFSSAHPLQENNDFATHLSDLTSAAENALKHGLRSISVPSLPHKLSNLLTKDSDNQESKEAASNAQYPVTGGKKRPHSLRRHVLGSPNAVSYSTPTKAHKLFNDKFLKSLMESNIFDSNFTQSGGGNGANDDEALTMTPGGSNNTGNVTVPNLADPRTTIHMIDLEQAKDIFQSLSQALSASSLLPIDQQEIALNLFYQIAERVEKVEEIALPVSFVRASPLLLPHPLQPIPLKVEEFALFKGFSSFVERQTSLFTQHQQRQAAGSAATSANDSPASATTSTFRFIVDPFSKRKEKKSNDLEEVYWNEDSICYLRVHFKNALSIPIHLTSLSPVLSGVKHVVYPISADIPPESELFEVFLPVHCLERGTIVIDAVRLKVGNFQQDIPLNAKGFPVRSSEVSGGNKTAVVTLTSEGSDSSPPSPLSQVIDTNTVKVVAEHLSVQCYTSWDASSLICAQGPTSNHLHTLTSYLSINSGEVRQEKLWLRLSPLSSPTDVRVFQVIVHEYEKVTMTRRSYLLKEFLATSSSTASVGFSQVTHCIIQNLAVIALPRSRDCSAGKAAESEAMDWVEVAFDVVAKPGVTSFDFDINTIVLPQHLYDSLSSYVAAGMPPELPIESSDVSMSWLRDYYSDSAKISDLKSLFRRKLVLHVTLRSLAGVSCSNMQLIHLSSSVTSEDDLLLRRLLLQQWQGGQRGRQRLLSIQTINATLMSDGLLSEKDNDVRTVSYLPPPTTMIFSQRIRILFLIRNQSPSPHLIGTSLERMRQQCGQLRQISTPSSTSSLIFQIEEVVQSDFSLVVPANTVIQLVIEYPQHLLRHYLKEVADKQAVVSALTQVPLFWLCCDEQKVTRAIIVDEVRKEVSWQVASASSAASDSLRFGRLELAGSGDVTGFVNLGFESDLPKPVTSSSSKGVRRPPVTDVSDAPTLSEVGKLLRRYPFIDTSATVSIATSPAQHLSLQQPSTSSSFTVSVLQKIDVSLVLQCDEGMGRGGQLELCLLLTDLLDDEHFAQLKADIDKQLNLEDDDDVGGERRGGVGNAEEGHDDVPPHRSEEEEDAPVTCTTSPPLSYLINGKFHCKYALTSASSIKHRVNVTFLNSSRYSLFVFFRLLSPNDTESARVTSAWWSCESPINFIVITPS